MSYVKQMLDKPVWREISESSVALSLLECSVSLNNVGWSTNAQLSF